MIGFYEWKSELSEREIDEMLYENWLCLLDEEDGREFVEDDDRELGLYLVK